MVERSESGRKITNTSNNNGTVGNKTNSIRCPKSTVKRGAVRPFSTQFTYQSYNLRERHITEKVIEKNLNENNLDCDYFFIHCLFESFRLVATKLNDDPFHMIFLQNFHNHFSRSLDDSHPLFDTFTFNQSSNELLTRALIFQTTKREEIMRQTAYRYSYRRTCERPKHLTNRDCCDFCGANGEMMLCDRCPTAVHLTCLVPMVESNSLVNENEWFCPSCSFELILRLIHLQFNSFLSSNTMNELNVELKLSEILLIGLLPRQLAIIPFVVKFIYFETLSHVIHQLQSTTLSPFFDNDTIFIKSLHIFDGKRKINHLKNLLNLTKKNFVKKEKLKKNISLSSSDNDLNMENVESNNYLELIRRKWMNYSNENYSNLFLDQFQIRTKQIIKSCRLFHGNRFEEIVKIDNELNESIEQSKYSHLYSTIFQFVPFNQFFRLLINLNQKLLPILLDGCRWFENNFISNESTYHSIISQLNSQRANRSLLLGNLSYLTTKSNISDYRLTNDYVNYQHQILSSFSLMSRNISMNSQNILIKKILENEKIFEEKPSADNKMILFIDDLMGQQSPRNETLLQRIIRGSFESNINVLINCFDSLYDFHQFKLPWSPLFDPVSSSNELDRNWIIKIFRCKDTMTLHEILKIDRELTAVTGISHIQNVERKREQRLPICENCNQLFVTRPVPPISLNDNNLIISKRSSTDIVDVRRNLLKKFRENLFENDETFLNDRRYDDIFNGDFHSSITVINNNSNNNNFNNNNNINNNQNFQELNEEKSNDDKTISKRHRRFDIRKRFRQDPNVYGHVIHSDGHQTSQWRQCAQAISCTYCYRLYHLECTDPTMTEALMDRWMCSAHLERFIANDFHLSISDKMKGFRCTFKMNFFSLIIQLEKLLKIFEKIDHSFSLLLLTYISLRQSNLSHENSEKYFTETLFRIIQKGQLTLNYIQQVRMQLHPFVIFDKELNDRLYNSSLNFSTPLIALKSGNDKFISKSKSDEKMIYLNPNLFKMKNFSKSHDFHESSESKEEPSNNWNDDYILKLQKIF
ncbi:hypothetical protein SNEBB_004815 [Seison nebaliae]|nr:hypothetical protein SNEBB_004815 [Seison nebaliae]